MREKELRLALVCFGGVSLGLSLVNSIAERHHGSVHCEDHAGGGASFVLRIPCDAL